MTTDDLEAEGSRCWEEVLNHVVGVGDTYPHEDVKQNLRDAGLLVWNSEEGVDEKTALGFRFLLDERRSQLWFYLLFFLGRLGVCLCSHASPPPPPFLFPPPSVSLSLITADLPLHRLTIPCD